MNQAWCQQVKLMTYNIRFDDAKDSINGWNQRKRDVLKIMKDSEAGIIGVQEALKHQILELNENLIDFEYIGVGRDDGIDHGEFSAILYNTNNYQVIKSETFWLSDTPDKPSYGWDAAFKRICTAALMKDVENDTEFWVFNTHFDHMGFYARRKSAELVVKKINQLNPDQAPAILMGDFNVTPFEKPYKIITSSLQDSRLNANEIKGVNIGTYNGFKNEFEHNRIDFIFTNKLNILFYAQINDKMRNGNYPSDHFPVIIELEIN